MTGAAAVLAWGVLGYFALYNLFTLVFLVLSFLEIRRYRRRYRLVLLGELLQSPRTPPVSVLVPAHNEEETIVENVRALMRLQYPQFEVIVVNDGSKDGTLAALVAAFDLRPSAAPVEARLPTARVRAVYRSLTHSDLVVIDKENGGKADALNAAIDHARFPFVCAIDADSLLEDDALLKTMALAMQDPRTVAVGGIVRIANGCRVERGRVLEVGLSKAPLPIFQTVEYLRAFLSGRMALSRLHALMIVSGAFGLFRKDWLIAAGGYRVGTVGEDMELVVRLHRVLQERKAPYRVAFIADPVCWTQAPERLRDLAGQRNRWQRGLLDSLWLHRGMLLNPRYGAVGLVGFPFFLLFEALAPVIEAAGWVTLPGLWAAGLLDFRMLALFLTLSLAWGMILAVGALILEESSYQRYPKVSSLLRLFGYALIESAGYRQLTVVWRLQGTLDWLRGKQAWGALKRERFA